jgi:3-oxoacyl-[acyl-carrier-protein] synthase-1
MTFPLAVIGMGAVTAAGLSAQQSCAAVRAGVANFKEVLLFSPPREPIITARVPARDNLKTPVGNWLANLAVRAISEAMKGHAEDADRTALLLTVADGLPDDGQTNAALITAAIQHRLRLRFHASSTIVRGGHAGVLGAVSLAKRLLQAGTVEYCVVGGVDSLVNGVDAARFSEAGRLHDFDNPQGLIPGEGAAFLLLSGNPRDERAGAQLLGIGTDHEVDTAFGERFAVGEGLSRALSSALHDAGCREEQITFRVSDMNGERYYAWDSMIAAMRFYRTLRSDMRVWYPAASTGDIGAAAGALGVIVAANAIARGFAPGPIAMVEGSSDDGLRAGCVVAVAPGRQSPPFPRD